MGSNCLPALLIYGLYSQIHVACYQVPTAVSLPQVSAAVFSGASPVNRHLYFSVVSFPPSIFK